MVLLIAFIFSGRFRRTSTMLARRFTWTQVIASHLRVNHESSFPSLHRHRWRFVVSRASGRAEGQALVAR